MNNTKVIRPQEGFQEKFLASPADIVIGGGAAGAGKSFVALMEGLRNIYNPEFRAVYFRRTYPEIAAPGGLIDESRKFYPQFGAKLHDGRGVWQFHSGASIKFSHLQYEKDIYRWQGSQIPLIVFDELTHFTKKMFFYMLSRNRSTSGIRPYIRATCNPDAESFVADMIKWWIGDDGYIIKERSGIIRYFIMDSDEYVWGATKDEIIDKNPHIFNEIPTKKEKYAQIKSLTFIEGSIYGNKELLKKDPGYLGNLRALPEAEQLALLKGNWKVSFGKENLINPTKFNDVFTNRFVQTGNMYITADVALQGSDTMVIGVWNGFRLEDIYFSEKTDGKVIQEKIYELAYFYKVPESNIAFDADGVGGYLDGYLPNAKPFHNGSSPLGLVEGTDGRWQKPNYNHLKSQCYFALADRINRGGLYISENVANMKRNNVSLSEIFKSQIKAIKKEKSDDGKLKVISKEQMKNILRGESPDYLDMLMMREVFELLPNYNVY